MAVAAGEGEVAEDEVDDGKEGEIGGDVKSSDADFGDEESRYTGGGGSVDVGGPGGKWGEVAGLGCDEVTGDYVNEGIEGWISKDTYAPELMSRSCWRVEAKSATVATHTAK